MFKFDEAAVDPRAAFPFVISTAALNPLLTCWCFSTCVIVFNWLTHYHVFTIARTVLLKKPDSDGKAICFPGTCEQ